MKDFTLTLTQSKEAPISSFMNQWEGAIRTLDAPPMKFSLGLSVELVRKVTETVSKPLVGNRHRRSRLKQQKREAWYRFSIWLAQGRMRIENISNAQQPTPQEIERDFHVEFHSSSSGG